jgi:hypothetical protein
LYPKSQITQLVVQKMLSLSKKLHRFSEIALLWRERATIIVRSVKSQPSPGLAAGAFFLLAVVGGAEARAIAVATRLKRVLVTKAPARRGVTRRAGRWMIRCN